MPLRSHSGQCSPCAPLTRESLRPAKSTARVVSDMRRNDMIKRILWPWSRRDTAPNESSPLIPKVSSAKEDAEELGNVPADIHHAGPNRGRDDGPAFAGIRPHYRYSFMDYFLKYLLILSNLVFTVVSLMALVLGMWGLVSKQSFAQEKIGSIGTDPMLAFLTVGSALTLLCLSGCVGALRENRALLKLFSAALLALIAAQVLTAIVAYSLQDQVVGFLRSGMLAAMVRYQDDLDLRFITDEIHRDWELNIYYNCSAPGVLACGVPATCCVDPLENGTVWNSQCGLAARLLDEFSAQSVIFLGGCLGGISRWIEQHEGLIGTVAVVVVGAQIVTLFISTRLLESIRWHKVYT